MGRKIVEDYADPATLKRRERQRLNQQRCIEKKRMKVMELEGCLKRIQKSLESNLSRYDDLRQQCHDMIRQLNRRKLSEKDKARLVQIQVSMTNTKKTVDQCKERLKGTETETDLNLEAGGAPPNLRKSTRSRLPVKDQAVPS